jgi:hypothetical protein
MWRNIKRYKAIIPENLAPHRRISYFLYEHECSVKEEDLLVKQESGQALHNTNEIRS